MAGCQRQQISLQMKYICSQSEDCYLRMRPAASDYITTYVVQILFHDFHYK